MFSLAIGFTVRMRKRSMTLKGEATSGSEEKRPRRSPLDEGTQKDWGVVFVEFEIGSTQGLFIQLAVNEGEPSCLDLDLVGFSSIIWQFP